MSYVIRPPFSYPFTDAPSVSVSWAVFRTLLRGKHWAFWLLGCQRSLWRTPGRNYSSAVGLLVLRSGFHVPSESLVYMLMEDCITWTLYFDKRVGRETEIRNKGRMRRRTMPMADAWRVEHVIPVAPENLMLALLSLRCGGILHTRGVGLSPFE